MGNGWSGKCIFMAFKNIGGGPIDWLLLKIKIKGLVATPLTHYLEASISTARHYRFMPWNVCQSVHTNFGGMLRQNGEMPHRYCNYGLNMYWCLLASRHVFLAARWRTPSHRKDLSLKTPLKKSRLVCFVDTWMSSRMVLPLLIALGAVAQPVGLAWHITNLT